MSDSQGVAVQAYEYPAAAIEASASWWSPGDIPADPEPTSYQDEEPKRPALVGAVEEQSCASAIDLERMGAELQERFETGKQIGFEEGRQVERQTAQQFEHARLKEQLASLVLKFDQETGRYLHEVEQEVATLALAIAARVLRREVQMDPLLLTGAVRVALGQLAKTAKVRLMVPASDLSLWAEAIAHIPNLALRPTVVACDGMNTGGCELETELGSVDLSIHSQLSEIERTLFDPVDQTASRGPVSGGVLPANDSKAAE